MSFTTDLLNSLADARLPIVQVPARPHLFPDAKFPKTLQHNTDVMARPMAVFVPFISSVLHTATGAVASLSSPGRVIRKAIFPQGNMRAYSESTSRSHIMGSISFPANTSLPALSFAIATVFGGLASLPPFFRPFFTHCLSPCPFSFFHFLLSSIVLLLSPPCFIPGPLTHCSAADASC